MHDQRTELATLIASRICHDLISPVGAISNGLELVSLGSGLSEGPEMALISESCENANARIRFFRVAYGAANETAQVSAGEVRSILEDLMRGTRLTVTWATESDCSRADVQLAFLGIQCLETAMRRGGEITITLEPGRIQLLAHADRLSADPSLWPHLNAPTGGTRVLGEPIGIAPAHVQFALLPMLASDRGRKPHYELSDGQMTLVV